MWIYVGFHDNDLYLYYRNMGYMNPVNMYDLNGSYIKSFENMICISENYKPSYIYRCCEGKFSTAYNYIWKYTNDNKKYL